MASSQDAWYLSLLGLAEHFRGLNPPDIKSCVQCLQAVFNFKPPPRVEARTHLQLGTILLTHTHNADLARLHLEKAWELSQTISSFDDVKFESASVLAQLFEQQQLQKQAKEKLRRAIEISQGNCYWHCRLLFQLAQLHAREKDYLPACSLLGVGVEFTRISGANYTQILFLLSKAMLLLAERKLTEAAPLLSQAGPMTEAWQGSPQQKEYLKVFFLVLQTCHYLLAGQVKCSKSWLKQLQQSVQEISQWADEDAAAPSTNPGDMFMWMPKEELCVVVYLVTVMHSMQAGYMDKAQKYSDKALTQIERISASGERPILRTFQLMILEHLVQCRLVMGDNTGAIREVASICGICRKRPSLLAGHRAQVHTVLGLYAMSMNCMEAAETQLNAALRTSQERELWTFVNMNLAIVYLRQGRQVEFTGLLDRISPESVPSQSHCLRAASYYIQGLHGFCQHMYNDAKRYLRETLKMANAEDLNRLTSCSLVLLGNIFLSLGNNRDSFNMVTPAMQLASKIPDINVQLWASAVLKDLYRSCGEHGKESAELQKQTGFSQTLLKDQLAAARSPHHALLSWTDGPVPAEPSCSPGGSRQGSPRPPPPPLPVSPASSSASSSAAALGAPSPSAAPQQTASGSPAPSQAPARQSNPSTVPSQQQQSSAAPAHQITSTTPTHHITSSAAAHHITSAAPAHQMTSTTPAQHITRTAPAHHITSAAPAHQMTNTASTHQITSATSAQMSSATPAHQTRAMSGAAGYQTAGYMGAGGSSGAGYGHGMLSAHQQLLQSSLLAQSQSQQQQQQQQQTYHHPMYGAMMSHHYPGVHPHYPGQH